VQKRRAASEPAGVGHARSPTDKAEVVRPEPHAKRVVDPGEKVVLGLDLFDNRVFGFLAASAQILFLRHQQRERVTCRGRSRDLARLLEPVPSALAVLADRAGAGANREGVLLRVGGENPAELVVPRETVTDECTGRGAVALAGLGQTELRLNDADRIVRDLGAVDCAFHALLCPRVAAKGQEHHEHVELLHGFPPFLTAGLRRGTWW